MNSALLEEEYWYCPPIENPAMSMMIRIIRLTPMDTAGSCQLSKGRRIGSGSGTPLPPVNCGG